MHLYKQKYALWIMIYFLSAVSYGNDNIDSYIESIPGTEESFKMIAIPSGTFMMGSPENEAGRNIDEGPIHKVELNGFWMSEVEITWDVFRHYMERTIDADRPAILNGKEVDIDIDGVTGATTPYTEMSFGMGIDGFPATSMTQLSAARFCQWLSAITGRFYRLPTEAEWEYACRAGSQKAYSFGSDHMSIDEYAWSEGNTDGGYRKVKMKKPNAWGLYDMHGNVAEWTLDQYVADAYQQYEGKLALSPWEEPTKTYPKVLKGGSWKDGADQLRSAARMASNKKWKKRDPQTPKSLWWHTDAPFIGIRIVRPTRTPRLERQLKYWGVNN